jgi:polysaccharide pyruvyl transferase WcaK-like protein
VGDIHIGLAWHAVAATNLGVGALTAGNLVLARQAAARAGRTPRFTIFSPVEHGQLAVKDADVVLRSITGRYMGSPGGFMADVRGLDVMLDISAGDSFTDIYPAKRFAYMMATKALPILLGKPLVLSPQTIGPFSRQPYMAMAGWVCHRAAEVFARDPLSMTAARQLAPDCQPKQVIDVAFALPFTRPDLPAGPVRVGINVSGLLMNGGYAGGNEYGLGFDYRALTHGLVQAFLAMPGVEVHLVPHVIAPHMPGDDDAAACDALRAQYPALHRAPDFTSASDAKSFISGLDFMTGARMHATIAAYSAGVPVVPISYSRKFEGLYSGLNYPWLVNANGMTTDSALALVLQAFAQRDELKADIAKGNEVVARGLEDYVAALTTLFRKAK